MKESSVYGILQICSVTILCRHYFELAKRTRLINKGFRSAEFPKNPYFSLFRAEVGLASPLALVFRSDCILKEKKDVSKMVCFEGFFD